MEKDYKDTLNLPETSFPMKANLPQNEPERLKRWEAFGIYEKMRQKGEGKTPYILHDGPPYANGHLHLGHALNKILKDIIVKYKTMKGFYTPYVPGWDCHGLPIEHEVDKRLGAKKDAISLIDKRQECRQYAEKFVDIQRDEFKRLGVFGLWDEPYLTMTHAYEATIVREFAKLFEAGYVYKGKKPVHWCPKCVTALAEAEVEYNEKISPSVYVAFRLNDEYLPKLAVQGDAYLVIWTTTPWTLPANLALAVHPDLNYAIIKKGEVCYIVAQERLQALEQKLQFQNLEIVNVVKGAFLEGLQASHPFIQRNSQVVCGDFVSIEEGTGLVHIAPGHGMEDYEVGLRYGLDIFAPVDSKGCFTTQAAEFAGQFVFKANPNIIETLKEKSALLHHEPITHTYPHCWRCKQPVIFRATEQWFVSMAHRGLRDNCLAEIERVQWIPQWGKSRILGMIKNRPDWCISRQRSWGAPIAVLSCSQCGRSVKDPDVMERIAEHIERAGADVWFTAEVEQFLPSQYQCAHCGGRQFVKETDILDVWFDSGVSHAGVLEIDKRLSWPASLYLEGSDQHRGWFQSSLLASVGARGKAPYHAVLTHGFVVDGQGKKMSKSLGNIISPQEIVKKHGAEILRLWVSAADYRDDMRISDEILKRLVEAYRKIRNTCRFLLGNTQDFTADITIAPEDLLEIDRFALSRLNLLVEKVDQAYNQFEFHEAFHSIYHFCVTDMSAFYLDVLKDRLYVYKTDSPQRRAAQWTLREILLALTSIMSPILSFTADEIWEHIQGDKAQSVFLADFPTAKAEYRNEALEEKWQFLIRVRNEVNKALELKRQSKAIGNSLEANVLIRLDNSTSRFVEEEKAFLPTLFIVSSVELKTESDTMETTYQSEEIEGLAIGVQKAGGQKCQRCWNWSEEVGAFERHPDLCGRCYQILTV